MLDVQVSSPCATVLVPSRCHRRRSPACGTRKLERSAHGTQKWSGGVVGRRRRARLQQPAAGVKGFASRETSVGESDGAGTSRINKAADRGCAHRSAARLQPSSASSPRVARPECARAISITCCSASRDEGQLAQVARAQQSAPDPRAGRAGHLNRGQRCDDPRP